MRNQSAFCKLYSTVTSLISSTDYWYKNIENIKLNLTIFLDIKKAFDTVDHEILMKKLNAYGVRGTPGKWLHSYLNRRKQYFSLNGNRPGSKVITCGIPQGSCLGPLLFILYLNTLKSACRTQRLVSMQMTHA